jgi:hypothetical protein
MIVLLVTEKFQLGLSGKKIIRINFLNNNGDRANN